MAQGRMVNRSIAEDDRLARLSIMAEYVFLKTIPHLDRDGMITGKPGLLFSRTHPTRDDLYGQTQAFIDEWVAVGLVILFNTGEGPALFFPGFAKNNRLPHYEREQPSRFPPPPGYARDGKNGPLFPAHQKPPSKMPKKPKEDVAPPSEDAQREPDFIVGNPPFGRDKELDEVMDEVLELLQDEVMDEVLDEIHHLADEVHPKLEVKYQSKVNGREENTTTNARALVEFARPLLLPEWNGGGGYLDSLQCEELIILSSWLWLYKKLKGGSAYARNIDAERYKTSPFAGVTNDCGFIRSKVAEGTPAPLHFAHRAEFDAELRTLQGDAAP